MLSLSSNSEKMSIIEISDSESDSFLLNEVPTIKLKPYPSACGISEAKGEPNTPVITGKERRKRTNLKPADFSLSSDFENNGVSTSDSDFSVKSESEDVSDANVSFSLVVGENVAANTGGDVESDKENETPIDENVPPSYLSVSSDSDFEAGKLPRSNKPSKLKSVKQAKKTTSAKLNTFVPAQGLRFRNFDEAYDKCQKYATNIGFRWRKTTGTKDRGPKKQFRIRRLVCQSYGTLQKTKNQGVRATGPSVRCGCKAAIQLYEHMVTGVTIMNKVELQHKYPCQPGVHQLLRGRRKAGVNPSSIPVEIVKDMANMFHTKVTTQSMRELLQRKANFPKSIIIDKDFIRSMRLYIEAHGILPDMPVDIVAGKLGLSSHMSAINYEDVVIAAGLANSSAALAARDGHMQHIQDVVAFLTFMENQDAMFSKKVVHLKGTDRIAAIFCMTGYQRAKLANFGDVLIFDCKRSGISTLDWPKPIATIIDQEGKLHDTVTGMMCAENYDM